MPSSPPPYLPTHELHSRLPRFLPNLIHPRLLATFDARDELTATALDDAPLAVSVSRDSFAASEKRGDRSFGGSNSSDAIGALRVVVVKQDAVVEATEVSVSSAEASSISPDELIQSIEEYEKNDSEFGGEMAVTPKALPPPPSASRLIPLGNSGPVRALKLSPATLNSNSNSQLLTATNSSPSVPFLAILRTPKSVELFSLGAHDGDPPKFIQEISRDRRNAEGIIGIEWTAAGDLLIVGSGGVEGWRWNPKRAEFVLRRSLAIPVSWYLYSSTPRLLILSSTSTPSALHLYHLAPNSLTPRALPPLRFQPQGEGVYLRPMRREFAVVEGYGGVFVLHIQGTRVSIHRISNSSVTLQGVHDLSALEYAGASQFLAGPVLDNGLVCVHELVGRSTALVDVRFGLIATTRIEPPEESADDLPDSSSSSESEEQTRDIYASLSDPSTIHPSTTSPSTLARYPFLLSPLSGRLYQLLLDPLLVSRAVLGADAPLDPLETTRFVLSKTGVPRHSMIVAHLRRLVSARYSPAGMKAMVQTILSSSSASAESSVADHADPSQQVAEALNSSLIDDDDEGLRPEDSRTGTPRRSRSVASSVISSPPSKPFSSDLRASPEVITEFEPTDLVDALQLEGMPKDAYLASLLIHLLPLLPLGPLLAETLIARGELGKLEQLVRCNVLSGRGVARVVQEAGGLCGERMGEVLGAVGKELGRKVGMGVEA